MPSSELIDLTRPAAVTELLKEARCVPCQRRVRRCLVEQYSGHCLQCSSSQECIFERSVIRSGEASAFTWEQLTGQASSPKRHLLDKEPGDSDGLHRDREVDFTSPKRPYEDKTTILPLPRITQSWYKDQGAIQKPQSQIYRKHDILDQTHLLSKPQKISLDFAEDFDGRLRKFMPIPAPSVGSYQYLHGDNMFKGSSRDEVKKHVETDHLLHRCGEVNCGKGFATANDLARHQVSVHKMILEGARMYRCFASGCAKPEKDWPRKDNFRSHLKKAHPHEDVDALVKKSDQWWDERHGRGSASTNNEDLVTLHGIGSCFNEKSPIRSSQAPSPSRIEPPDTGVTGQAAAADQKAVKSYSREEWLEYKPLIDQLYRVELRSIGFVQKALRERGFFVNERMIKTRIREWRLDKKHKESEMRTAVAMLAERGATTESSFRIRGRHVSYAEVLQYFRRKNIANPVAWISALKDDKFVPSPDVEILVPALGDSSESAANDERTDYAGATIADNRSGLPATTQNSVPSACWRCRYMKEKCSDETPCGRCKVVNEKARYASALLLCRRGFLKDFLPPLIPITVSKPRYLGSSHLQPASATASTATNLTSAMLRLVEQELEAILSLGPEENREVQFAVGSSATYAWPNQVVHDLFWEVQQCFKNSEHGTSGAIGPETTFYRLALLHLLHLKRLELSSDGMVTEELLSEFHAVLDLLENLIFEPKGRRKPTQPLKTAIIAVTLLFLIEQSLTDLENEISKRSLISTKRDKLPKREAVLTICSLFGLEYGSLLETSTMDQELADPLLTKLRPLEGLKGSTFWEKLQICVTSIDEDSFYNGGCASSPTNSMQYVPSRVRYDNVQRDAEMSGVKAMLSDMTAALYPQEMRSGKLFVPVDRPASV